MSHASRLRYLSGADGETTESEHRSRHHRGDLIYVAIAAMLVAIASLVARARAVGVELTRAGGVLRRRFNYLVASASVQLSQHGDASVAVSRIGDTNGDHGLSLVDFAR